MYRKVQAKTFFNQMKKAPFQNPLAETKKCVSLEMLIEDYLEEEKNVSSSQFHSIVVVSAF